MPSFLQPKMTGLLDQRSNERFNAPKRYSWDDTQWIMASFSAYSTTETFHEKSFVPGVSFALLGSFSPNIRGSRLRVWLLAKFGGLLSRMELRTGIMIP